MDQIYLPIRSLKMKPKKLIVIVTMGALAIATAFGAVLYRGVKAAEPAQSWAAQTANTNTTSGNPGKGFGDGMRGGYTSQDLATALGITTDQLSAAYQTANQAALKQAVDQGLITQAQADEITANNSAFPLGGRWADWLSQKGIDFDALLANALGITVDKLQAAYLQAYNTRIDQAVTDGNLTQAQADLMKGQNALYANKAFQSAMQSAYESAVKQAVTDGVITQAQADQILANGSGMNFLGPKGMGDQGMGGRGMGGSRGGHGQNGFDPNGQPGSTSTDTTTPSTSTTTP
jgi:hypothetical protein